MAFPQLFSRNARGTVELSHSAAHLLAGTPETTYQSDELFGSKTQITIAHHGQNYSLRITSQGKLLLTK